MSRLSEVDQRKIKDHTDLYLLPSHQICIQNELSKAQILLHNLKFSRTATSILILQVMKVKKEHSATKISLMPAFTLNNYSIRLHM